MDILIANVHSNSDINNGGLNQAEGEMAARLNRQLDLAAGPSYWQWNQFNLKMWILNWDFKLSIGR